MIHYIKLSCLDLLCLVSVLRLQELHVRNIDQLLLISPPHRNSSFKTNLLKNTVPYPTISKIQLRSKRITKQ